MHTPPGAESFQASGNIHAIAENVITVNDDVTDIDANSEYDAPVLGYIRIAADHGALDDHSVPDRVDDAGKFDQRAIACRFDDAAMMEGNCRVDHLTAMGFQRFQGADLIGARQPAISDDICGENGCKSTVDVRAWHGSSLQGGQMARRRGIVGPFG